MTTGLVGRDLRFIRAGRAIVDGVSLSVSGGQVLAVTGPSGSGKSSLLAMLAGLERPDEGSVAYGDSVRVGDPLDGVGLVLQGYGLVGILTAAENVEVVLQAGRVPGDESRRLAHDALASLDLSDVADHRADQLSGGQQQRVALARALVARPRLLIADEPTAQLDIAARDRALSLILAAAREGAAVVVATHDPAVAGLADSRISLRDGRVA
jgi:putative ABC transport system ATP-binding protein